MDHDKPPLPRLDAALRQLAESRRRSLTSHPAPEELAAYHAGELAPEAEPALLDHLAVCRDCSDLLLHLAGFADLEPPAGVAELTDEQVENDWQQLRFRMRSENQQQQQPEKPPPAMPGAVPIRPAPPPPPPLGRAARGVSLWLPVAASVLAVLGVLSGMYQSVRAGALERQLEQQKEPWSATSLVFAPPMRSVEEDVQRVSARDGAILSFYLDDVELYPAYEAEIAGHARIPLAPPRDEDHGLVLVLPPGYLQAGERELEIRLFGVQGETRVPVDRHRIRVDDP